MLILPVIDLKGGVVVRGIAGRRQEYRPIESRLTSSCQPIDVARAFRDSLGLSKMYLADLDAIAGAAPAFSVYDGIRALSCRLWVDAGVRRRADASALAAAGIDKIVVGLETIASRAELREICQDVGGGRVAFSLDLVNGRPLCSGPDWQGREAWSIAEEAIASGIRAMIVLDVARVGVGGGTGTEELCRRLAETYPEVMLVAGGGVRDSADLARLGQCGVKAVLVASALHDGRDHGLHG